MMRRFVHRTLFTNQFTLPRFLCIWHLEGCTTEKIKSLDFLYGLHMQKCKVDRPRWFSWLLCITTIHNNTEESTVNTVIHINFGLRLFLGILAQSKSLSVQGWKELVFWYSACYLRKGCNANAIWEKNAALEPITDTCIPIEERNFFCAEFHFCMALCLHQLCRGCSAPLRVKFRRRLRAWRKCYHNNIDAAAFARLLAIALVVLLPCLSKSQWSVASLGQWKVLWGLVAKLKFAWL